MIELKNLGEGFLIENKLYFTYGDCQSEYINLLAQKGINMNYGCHDLFKIDYPGEYDKENIFIVCYLGDGDRLNYFVRINEQYIAIIQNPRMAEKEEFQDVRICLYTDDQTLKVLEKLEYEGKTVKLDANSQQENDRNNNPEPLPVEAPSQTIDDEIESDDTEIE